MNKNLKISVLSTGELELEVPEVGEVSRAYIYGQATNDGEWHKVMSNDFYDSRQVIFKLVFFLSLDYPPFCKQRCLGSA